MSDKPYISVVIPMYKAEKYISKCVNSIIDQDFVDIEIILVDDGSPDNCGLVAEGFAENDSRIKVFHSKNQGVSAARNLGFSHSTGEYVLFVDADDELECNAVSKIASTDASADLIVFGWKEIGDDGGVIRETIPPELSETDVNGHIKNCLDYQLSEYIFTYAFRRRALEQLGFAGGFLVENCKLFEDVLSIQRLLRVGSFRISYISLPLYRYRQVAGSATHRRDPALAKDGLNAIRALSDMKVPDGYRDKWNAKLLLMAISGADWAAGPGFRDGQQALHKEIRKEALALVSAGATRGLTMFGKMKLYLYLIGVYRLLRICF